MMFAPQSLFSTGLACLSVLLLSSCTATSSETDPRVTSEQTVENISSKSTFDGAASTPNARPTIRVVATVVENLNSGASAWQLEASVNRGSYLYCFYRDEAGAHIQLFPNKYQPNPWIKASSPLLVPDSIAAQNIKVSVPNKMSVEFMCFATDSEVRSKLPSGLRKPSFHQLDVSSFEEIKVAFSGVAGANPRNDRFLTQ